MKDGYARRPARWQKAQSSVAAMHAVSCQRHLRCPSLVPLRALKQPPETPSPQYAIFLSD
jgi:hypothetical protein